MIKLPKNMARNVGIGFFFVTLLALLFMSSEYDFNSGIVLGIFIPGYAWLILELDKEGL